MIKRIFKNSGWLLADRVLRLVVGLFVTGLLSRYLGPNQFGLWGYAIALTTIFIPLANLELEQVIIKEMLVDPDNQENILTTGLILRFFGSSIVCLLVLLLNFFTIKEPQTQTLTIILSVGFVFQAFDVVDFYYHSQLRPVYSVVCRSISYLVFQSLKIALIYLGASLLVLVSISIFESLLGAGLILLHFIMVEKRRLIFSINFNLAKKLLIQSSPIIIANSIGFLLSKLDQIYVGKFLSPEMLGNYVAATRLTELGYVLIGVISAAAFPFIAVENNENESQSNSNSGRNIGKLLGLLFILTAGISLITLIFSKQLTMLVYGREFLYSSDILKVHIWTTIPYALTICSRFWFIKEQKTKWIIVNTSMGLVSAVALIYFLNLFLGIRGIALAICISMFVSSTLSNFFFASTRDLLKLQLHGIASIFRKKI